MCKPDVINAYLTRLPLGLDETIDAKRLAAVGNFIVCSSLPEWGEVGELAVIRILKALGLFPVFPSQTRWQSSPELGVFNLEDHLSYKLTSTHAHLCPRGTGKVDELVVRAVPFGWSLSRGSLAQTSGFPSVLFPAMKSESGSAHRPPQTRKH